MPATAARIDTSASNLSLSRQSSLLITGGFWVLTYGFKRTRVVGAQLNIVYYFTQHRLFRRCNFSIPIQAPNSINMPVGAGISLQLNSSSETPEPKDKANYPTSSPADLPLSSPLPNKPPSPTLPTPQNRPNSLKSPHNPNLPHLASALLRGRISSHHCRLVAHRAVFINTEGVENRDAAGGGHGNCVDYVYARLVQ